jgi:hypothetical protein
MRIIFIAAIILLSLTGSLFAEGSLCLDNNNPQATCKIINLKDDDINSLLIKDYTTFIFKKKTETFKDVAAGDLLVAGACKKFPNGFIRKIVTVRQGDSGIVIETVEGTFVDMLGGRIADTAWQQPGQSEAAAHK